MKLLFNFFLFFAFLTNSFALDLMQEKKDALKEKKLILLSVEREHCGYCEKMHKEVFSPKENVSLIEKHYIQKIVKADKIQLPKSLNVKFFPTNYIINPKDMSVVDEFVGYVKPSDFLELIDMIYEQEITN